MSSSSGGGWMNANKSAKQIQASKQKALKKRQEAAAAKRRGKPPNGSKKMNAASRRPTKKQSKSGWEDEEDDDSLDDDDDFVMSDEDGPELEEAEFRSEDEEEESDLEEMELVDDDDDDESDNGENEVTDLTGGSRSRQERAAARMNTGRRNGRNAIKRSSPVSLDDNSDSDEEDGFLSRFRNTSAAPRKSAPSKLLQQKQKAAKANRLRALDASAAMKPSAKNKRKESLTGGDTLALAQPPLKKSFQKRKHSDWSDSEDELTSPEAVKASRNPTADGSKVNPLAIDQSDSSDDDDDETPKKPAARSKYFEKMSTTQQPTKKHDVIDLHNSDDDQDASGLMDTPDQPQVRKKKGPQVHRSAFGEEDSDEDIPQNRSNPNTQDDNTAFADSDEDEDIKAAIKLSKKQLKKDKAKQAQKQAATEMEPEIENLADSSDDDGGGDDHEGDDDYDEEREAATSVLKTAEQLSAQVVSTMRSWSGSHNSAGGDSQGSQGSAVQGIIVDGAVSLGNLVVDKVSRNQNSANHEWISQEEMKQICPDVKLSDYQLIGVNWMRLLHGMKCTVGNKATNVNGVLADEMGLGKTVQTICFLASLNYHGASAGPNGTGNEKPPVPMPHLIVVPVSTLPNWVREFEKFSPKTRVLKYYGSQEQREELNQRLRQYHPDRLASGSRPRNPIDVVVAPVTYFQNEKSPDRKLLSRIDYEYLVSLWCFVLVLCLSRGNSFGIYSYSIRLLTKHII
jgi:hypothetical protein